MRCALAVLGTLWLIACGGSEGGSPSVAGAAGGPSNPGGAGGPSNAGASLAGCSEEIAAGYPKLGRDGVCGSHIVYRINGFDEENASAQGMVEIGAALGRISMTDGSDFNVLLPLHESGSAAYGPSDCTASGVEFGTQAYSTLSAYDANAKRLTVTTERDGAVLWGDLEGDYCRVGGYTSVGGVSEPYYKCQRLSGKFAARVEASSCDPECAGNVRIEGKNCLLPTCSSSAACEITRCPSSSPSCEAAIPVPNGTFRTDNPGHGLVFLEVSFEQGKLSALALERMTPFDGNQGYAVAYDPAKELPREAGGFRVNEMLARDPPGDPGRFNMLVSEQVADDGSSELFCRQGSFDYELTASTIYFDNFSMPKL